MPKSKVTTSLSIIRDWAEKRSGKPSMVDTFDQRENRLLGISLPGRTLSEPVRIIPWDEWYDIFRKYKLQFMYEEKRDDGELSFKYKIAQRKV